MHTRLVMAVTASEKCMTSDYSVSRHQVPRASQSIFAVNLLETCCSDAVFMADNDVTLMVFEIMIAVG